MATNAANDDYSSGWGNQPISPIAVAELKEKRIQEQKEKEQKQTCENKNETTKEPISVKIKMASNVILKLLIQKKAREKRNRTEGASIVRSYRAYKTRKQRSPPIIRRVQRLFDEERKLIQTDADRIKGRYKSIDDLIANLPPC
jgi:hypothetical protein